MSFWPKSGRAFQVGCLPTHSRPSGFLPYPDGVRPKQASGACPPFTCPASQMAFMEGKYETSISPMDSSVEASKAEQRLSCVVVQGLVTTGDPTRTSQIGPNRNSSRGCNSDLRDPTGSTIAVPTQETKSCYGCNLNITGQGSVVTAP